MRWGIWFEATKDFYRFANGAAVAWPSWGEAEIACRQINKGSVVIGEVVKLV